MVGGCDWWREGGAATGGFVDRNLRKERNLDKYFYINCLLLLDRRNLTSLTFLSVIETVLSIEYAAVAMVIEGAHGQEGGG